MARKAKKAAKKSKSKAKKAVKRKAVKKSVKRKAVAAKRPTSAKKAPAKKAVKAAKRKAPAKKKPVRKAAKRAPAKKQIGEGDYQASRNFLKDQGDFVKKHQSEIPAMGKAAEAALDGPEGDSLREAEALAEGRSRDTF